MVNKWKVSSEPLISPFPNLRDISLSYQRSSVLASRRELSSPDCGSILFIALWSLCLLTVFAIYLGYAVRQKIILVKRINIRNNTHFIAEAGIKQAIAEVRKGETPEYDALNQSWSNNPGLFQKIDLGYGAFSVGYNYYDSQSGSQKMRFGLMDEERKLNLNKAELDEIQRLVMAVLDFDQTEAQSLAAAIVDYRDSDSDLSVPLGSAEDRYYRNLSHPYEAKDAEFEVFEELLLVAGMNYEILDKLKGYITVYSNGKLNINTAPVEVLAALNLEQDLINKIISLRCGEDEIEATADDNVFTSPSNIISELSEFGELSPDEIADLSNLISSGKISTASHNFMARAVAQSDKQESEIICIFTREGKILYWKEE